MSYSLDQGLVVAAERYAAEVNSHGILSLLKEYRFWVDLANSTHGSKDAELSAVRHEGRLRQALIANQAADWIERKR